MEKQKTLFRSKKNRILAGICGGVGEYMGIDSSMIRLIWLLVVVFTGFFPGLLAYIIAIFIIPEKLHK